MISIDAKSGGNVIGFTLSGRLHDEDYQTFVPAVEQVMEKEGNVRLLARFHDFHGWNTHALWDDIKFAAKHRTDIERIALVGDRKWEEWMAKVCKPFTAAEVRYFDANEIGPAWDWVAETS